MRTLLSFTVKAFLILILALQALPSAAQDARSGQDENRARITDAVARGDSAAAERLFAELSSNKAGIPQKSSVAFEELKACGFYPQGTRLECILDIKSALGGVYAGAPTGRATHEFVTFFVDWNCDNLFSADEAVGLGIVHMHDEAAGAAGTWQYAVYRDIDPPGSLSNQCFMRTGPGGNPVMTKTRTLTLNARAILSWFAPVTSPTAVPFWGNTINFRIRLDPIR